MIALLTVLIALAVLTRLAMWALDRPNRRMARSLCLYCISEYPGWRARCPHCGEANGYSGWTNRPGMRSACGAEGADGQPLRPHRVPTWALLAGLAVVGVWWWAWW